MQDVTKESANPILNLELQKKIGLENFPNLLYLY